MTNVEYWVEHVDRYRTFDMDGQPFRCSRCLHMVTNGKWVSVGLGPGHYAAACTNEWACRLRRLWPL